MTSRATFTVFVGALVGHRLINLELQHLDGLRFRCWRLGRQHRLTIERKGDEAAFVHAICPAVCCRDIAAQTGNSAAVSNQQGNVLPSVNGVGNRRRGYSQPQVV